MKPQHICIEKGCRKKVWRQYTRCRSHAEKYKIYPSRKGKKNNSYIDGRSNKIYKCELCRKKIDWHTGINGSGYCHSCACKIRYTNPKNHPMYGKKRLDVSLRMRGKNNIAYVHGKYLELYSRGWTKIFKEQIRERDNFECQFCGIKQKNYYRKLDIHHKDYNKKNINIKNLITLCHTCHMKTNYNRNYWIKYFNCKENKK